MTQAEYLISRFGGLTSLARALGLAVSVVQGWKNRGFVPGKRLSSILAAGQALDPPLTEGEFFRRPDGSPHETPALAA